MKVKREHIVPLSSQALEILEMMEPISDHREHLFPSRHNTKVPMNSQTANSALKRSGYGRKFVAHGLRSIASTALNKASSILSLLKRHLHTAIKMKSAEHIIVQHT